MPGEHSAISEEFLFGVTERSNGFVGFFIQGNKNSREISDGEKIVKTATANLGLSNGRLVFAEKGAGREYFEIQLTHFLLMLA